MIAFYFKHLRDNENRLVFRVSKYNLGRANGKLNKPGELNTKTFFLVLMRLISFEFTKIIP